VSVSVSVSVSIPAGTLGGRDRPGNARSGVPVADHDDSVG